MLKMSRFLHQTSQNLLFIKICLMINSAIPVSFVIKVLVGNRYIPKM